MHAWRAHDVLVADPRGLAPAVHRDRRRAGAGAGAVPVGEDEPRRVRDGLVDRELRVRPDPQPARPVAGARRLERRIGGGGRGGLRAARARLRHRRLDPAARGALRRRRREADLRLVSRYGLIAFACSLDQIGPFADDVTDAALLLDVIAGHDPLDSTSIPDAGAAAPPVLDRGVDGLRIGIVEELTDVDGIAAGGARRGRARGAHAREGRRDRRSGERAAAPSTGCPRTT